MVNSKDIHIKSLSQNVIRVLVVSPDPGFAEFMRNGLREREAVYQIEEFPHIREVLRTISRSRTDLILWDCSKTRKDDFDQMVELRASVPAIPIVIVLDEANEQVVTRLEKSTHIARSVFSWVGFFASILLFSYYFYLPA